MAAENRRDTRYSLKQGHVIAAQLTCANDEPATGDVVDLSKGGAKLTVDKAIEENSAVDIRLSCESMDWALNVPGMVHWKQPTRNHGCTVGCSFINNLAEATIERLAVAGIIERGTIRD